MSTHILILKQHLLLFKTCSKMTRCNMLANSLYLSLVRPPVMLLISISNNGHLCYLSLVNNVHPISFTSFSCLAVKLYQI